MSQHPVDKVREATDLATALRCLQEGIEYEQAIDKQQGNNASDVLAGYARQVKLAHLIYSDVQARMHRLLVRELMNAGLTEFAEAVESGDYGRLAF